MTCRCQWRSKFRMADLRKVLITGASGMVGRNLIENTDLNNFELLTPTSTELNLTNYSEVFRYVESAQPDFVIHSAGKVGGILANMHEPISFLDDNLTIGRNIIMSSFRVGVKNFINLASTCMYPRNVANPLTEDLILKGELEPTNEGYALAKIASTRLCQYISKQHPDLNYKTLIPCNLYGRFDKFSPNNSHLLPSIIKKVHEAKVNCQEEVEIWGDGTARREFMYAGDLSLAIWKAVNDITRVPDLLNCGLGYDYTINEYYSQVAEVVGWEGTFVHDLERPVGMKQKLCDISRQKNWGWAPEVSLSEGIKRTYRYYLESNNQ
jgi:GDP-L-fucose synthase